MLREKKEPKDLTNKEFKADNISLFDNISLDSVALVPCAGSGQRFKTNQPKQYNLLAKKPIIIHTIERLKKHPHIKEVIIAVSPGYEENFKNDYLKPYNLNDINVVGGGLNRQASVFNAFKAIKSEAELILIHDAVRPLVSEDLITKVIRKAKKYGAALAAFPSKDTLKQVENKKVIKTLNRNLIWQAQTPQVFEKNILNQALIKAQELNFIGTDEASLMELISHHVYVVESSLVNLKITWPLDLELAEFFLKKGY